MEHAQNTCGFGLMAVSLGYFDTLLSMSGSTTSSELNESEKASAGKCCTVDALCTLKSYTSCDRTQQVTLPCTSSASSAGPLCTEPVRTQKAPTDRLCAYGASCTEMLYGWTCTAAGIPSGLVRMSVGITGTLEQRWLQLRESYLAATSGHSKPIVHSIDAMAEVQAQKMADIITSQPLPDGPPHKVARTEGTAR